MGVYRRLLCHGKVNIEGKKTCMSWETDWSQALRSIVEEESPDPHTR